MSGVYTTANDVDVDLRQAVRQPCAEMAAHLCRRAARHRRWRFAFAWLATPHYKAETRLLIETRESVFTRPDAGNAESDKSVLDEEGVTSQVEVIGSTDILKQVAQQARSFASCRNSTRRPTCRCSAASWSSSA